MYANFYYQRSTKKYGRGPWLDPPDDVFGDPLLGRADFLYIGQVYDQELFKDVELKP